MLLVANIDDFIQDEFAKETEFKNEMEKRFETNPEQFKPENAAKWTVYEVVHWIEDMAMEGYIADILLKRAWMVQCYWRILIKMY